MKKVTVGSAISRPNQKVRGTLKVATVAGRKVKIPVVIAQGPEPGPTMFISGGMHGNELNGVRLAHIALHGLNPKKLAGTVIFMPVLNTSGYEDRERDVRYDSKDLNRCFSKKKKFTVSDRIAQSIREKVIAQCEFGIDCHDAGGRTVLLPHPRFHSKEKVGSTKEMAKMLGTDILLRRKGARGMMAVEANRYYGIPVLTVEAGGAMVVWPEFMKRAHQGIHNILTHYNMMKGEIKLPKKQYVIDDIYRSSYVAKSSGIIHMKVKLGDAVNKGDVLAEIHDPIHEREEYIISKYHGVVFSRVFQNKIDHREIVCSVLKFAKHGARNRIAKHGETIHNVQGVGKRIVSSKIFDEALKLKY